MPRLVTLQRTNGHPVDIQPTFVAAVTHQSATVTVVHMPGVQDGYYVVQGSQEEVAGLITEALEHDLWARSGGATPPA